MPFDLLRKLRLAKTARFWGKVAAGDALITWLHEPAVRRYVNECITGDPNVWPIDGFAPRFGPLRDVVTLGCGDGVLDRQLRERGICDSLIGIDISQGSLAVARREAEDRGLTNLTYSRGDMDSLVLEENSCDAFVFQQSLHHVANLEDCLDTVRAALRPGGLIYLDEYIGPSQSEWSRDLLREADRVYGTLPKAVRRRRHLQLPVDGKDPSEAIRSSEIIRELSSRFTIEVRRDYGGNYLSVIYPHLDFSRVDATERDDILERLIGLERIALGAGAPSFCAVILARKAA